jgi:serine/threonine protein kinase
VSDDAKDLISKLLLLDVTKRYTVDQALEHPWIKASGSELELRRLDSNLGELKKFQGNKRFKKAAHTIIATQKFKNLVGNLKKKGDVAADDGNVLDELAAPGGTPGATITPVADVEPPTTETLQPSVT